MSGTPDPAWLDGERKKIEDELQQKFESRIEASLEEARHRGREEGLESGRAEALEAFERQREAVAQTLARIAGRAEGELAGAEDLIVGLVFEAVCKILAKETVNRDAIRAMVQQILDRASREEAVRVRLHPQDCELLGEAAGPEFTRDGGRMRVELVPDEEIVLGGCIVEAGRGCLDARIETQLQGLRDTVMRVRNGKTQPGEAES
jgi:flagellar assembly protein FliH